MRAVRLVAAAVLLAGCEGAGELVGPAAAKAMIDRGGVVLLDVRTAGEFSAERIAGATLIPVQELEARVGEIAEMKGKPVLVYCRSGRRSALAVRILQAAGFRKLHDLEGGLIAWKKEGLPVTRGE